MVLPDVYDGLGYLLFASVKEDAESVSLILKGREASSKELDKRRCPF
jgi:hypothetical protein